MCKQYFCLKLEDFSAPSFCSFSKCYYGTLDDVRKLICALESKEKTKHDMEDLIHAFQSYEQGNHAVMFNVAYQEGSLLVPVKVIGKTTCHLENFEWDHLNTWKHTYRMRCDTVDTIHLWIQEDDHYKRIMFARFQGLCMESLIGNSWRPLEDGFWGFPMMIILTEQGLINQLAVEEDRFNTETEALEDCRNFSTEKINFTEFCNDLFGDG